MRLLLDARPEKFEVVINQVEPKILSDPDLKILKFLVIEFQNLAGFDIDHVVMVVFRTADPLITGAAATEIRFETMETSSNSFMVR